MGIVELERRIKNDEDGFEVVQLVNGWLRVVWIKGETFMYYHDVGRSSKPLTRESADVIARCATA